eukprot:1149174-Pelagomonas_calceolata.AAC.2
MKGDTLAQRAVSPLYQKKRQGTPGHHEWHGAFVKVDNSESPPKFRYFKDAHCIGCPTWAT